MDAYSRNTYDIPETARLGIVCEGRDEEVFLQEFFKATMKADYDAGRIFVVNAGSNSEIGTRLLSLKGRLARLQYLAVVRDAEKDTHGAQQSVRSAFTKGNFCIVPKAPGRWYAPTSEMLEQHKDWEDLRTGYLLFPTCDSHPCPGMLEDLAMNTIRERDAEVYLGMADKYLDEVRKQRGLDAYKQPHKNRFYAYLAGVDNAAELKIGEAAKQNVFDWSSPSYDYMKKFFEEALR